MRTAGWICLIIGVISFFGAALKGNSVFGPLFWIGLGAFLLDRANKRKQKTESDPIKTENLTKVETRTQEVVVGPISDNNQADVDIHADQQLESLEDIQAQLTLPQREAAMCMISFFCGYNSNLTEDASIMLLKQSALFYGLPDSPLFLSKIMSKYSDADTLLDIVLTIKPVKAKEFLLLSCYDLIKSTGKQEAFDLLFNIANDMGYDRTKMEQLILLYQ